MKKRHSLEEKLLAVQKYLDGVSSTRIEKEFGIDHHDVLIYVSRYESHGKEGLNRIFHAKFSSDFKRQVVREYQEEAVSLRTVAIKYGISLSTVKLWVRMIANHGQTVFDVDRKEHGVMGRPRKKEPETELEKLQAENRRLRAENDLLKKVKALVEERETRLRALGRKPSRN